MIHIGNASIVTPNLPAINGYLHIIDQVSAKVLKTLRTIWLSEDIGSNYITTGLFSTQTTFEQKPQRNCVSAEISLENTKRLKLLCCVAFTWVLEQQKEKNDHTIVLLLKKAYMICACQ